MKELRFSWDAISDATFYRLFEDPDGLSGFSQVGTDLTSLSYNHAIAVHRRSSASYRLDACNSAGCGASAVVTPGSSLTQAIGYVTASNSGIADGFGAAVALSADGSTLVVGAAHEDSGTTGVNSTPDEGAQGAGAAYVFVRSGGVWVEQAYLKASHTINDDHFGTAVALSADGNMLAVGAAPLPLATSPNPPPAGPGGVYVFTRSAGMWSQQAHLQASNAGPDDQFGSAVAISADGSTLVVGARGEDSGTAGVNSTPDEALSASGAVYVFTRTAAAWSQQAYLKASNPGSGDSFGDSVALSTDGDTLAVGAPFEDGSDVRHFDDFGAVYVFTRSAAVWSQQAYLRASNPHNFAFFGSSVTLSGNGNTLAAGAPWEDSSAAGVMDGAPQSGAAYVFVRSAALWSQHAYLKASNAGSGDEFGNSVALSVDGSSLAVGAYKEASSTKGVNSSPNEAAPAAGAVYVFARGGSAWSQQAYVKASNTASGSWFGVAVALNADGGTLAVGASIEGDPSMGAAYLY